MRTIAWLAFSALFTLCSVSTANSAIASKPLEVIQLSHGYPIGPHHNLNIYGKIDYMCDYSSEGGDSVFINEYGDSRITYVTNKESGVSELTALDKCAEAFDGDPAKVQLPYESDGYYVFAAIKGKPNNGINQEANPESPAILSPNLVREACSDISEDKNLASPDFPNYADCPDDALLALGLISGNNVYEATDVGFVRFDPAATAGKGKSKGTDIADLFMWTGWIFAASLDANDDGEINELDVPLAYDLIVVNQRIDAEEFDIWLADQADAGLAAWYENEWIHNIADLVLTGHSIGNDGPKVLKVRFYPVATTEYTHE